MSRSNKRSAGISGTSSVSSKRHREAKNSKKLITFVDVRHSHLFEDKSCIAGHFLTQFVDLSAYLFLKGIGGDDSSFVDRGYFVSIQRSAPPHSAIPKPETDFVSGGYNTTLIVSGVAMAYFSVANNVSNARYCGVIGRHYVHLCARAVFSP